MLQPFTMSRTALPSPPTDFRKEVKGDREKSWLILQQTHRQSLQFYYLVLTRHLSRIEGLEITTLREILLYEYYCDSNLIDKVVSFLLNSVDVELEALPETVNAAVLFKAPRIKISAIGPYSVFIPHERYH